MKRDKAYRLRMKERNDRRSERIVARMGFGGRLWITEMSDRFLARVHEDPTKGFHKCDCDWCTSGGGIRQEKLSTIDFNEWKKSWKDDYQEDNNWYYWDEDCWTGFYCRYEDCDTCSACETYLYSKKKEMEKKEEEWESIYDSVANY